MSGRVFDVAIVGGGPAGLLAATRCAEAGLDVLLLEEHGRIGEPVHCTGITSLEATDFAKIPEEIVLKRLGCARLVAPIEARCDVRWDLGASEPILALDRGAFDRSLADQAVAAGAELGTRARVDGIAPDADGVDLIAGGRTVRARAAVLACGVSYRLHRQLRLGLPAQVIHTAQVEVEAEASDTVELYFGREIAPNGFLWAVPITRAGSHRLKIGVMAEGDTGARLERFLTRPAVRERLAADPAPPTRRLLPLKPIPRTYADRLLVVGDAAGRTKPTTGGGIFYGLLTATLAADTLIAGFRAGRLDAGFLARYERGWRARLGEELRVAGLLRRVVTRCSDAEIESLVRAIASEDLQDILRGKARFNWHREVILTLLHRPGIASALCRAFFR